MNIMHYLCTIALVAALVSGSKKPAAAEITDGVIITSLPENMKGWAKNSVNTVIFRKDPLATHGDTQYIAYYDENGTVVLGKRTLGSDDWKMRRTDLSGNSGDAHNAISIAVDGAGYLHMAWDHHGHDLNYVRSAAPGSLELTGRLAMTGKDETKVTYPEFFNLPDGDLLCMYRVGSSGNGRTMLNRYDIKTGRWSIVQHPLIDGLDERNAYTNQIAVDSRGGWHVSWCWRETGGVQTNHDICYAVSRDGGETWCKSNGEPYKLPITSDNAEYILRIPQNSELINHTSMTTDTAGNPLIATYWRPEGTPVPQYHVIRFDGNKWNVSQVGTRKTPFSLSGGGTKRIPISRPKILVDRHNRAIMIFRDEERGSRVMAAVSSDPERKRWEITALSDENAGLWEPAYDTALWQRDNILHLFVQTVGQGDGETLEDLPPQRVYVYEWRP